MAKISELWRAGHRRIRLPRWGAFSFLLLPEDKFVKDGEQPKLGPWAECHDIPGVDEGDDKFPAFDESTQWEVFEPIPLAELVVRLAPTLGHSPSRATLRTAALLLEQSIAEVKREADNKAIVTQATRDLFAREGT